MPVDGFIGGVGGLYLLKELILCHDFDLRTCDEGCEYTYVKFFVRIGGDLYVQDCVCARVKAYVHVFARVCKCM